MADWLIKRWAKAKFGKDWSLTGLAEMIPCPLSMVKVK